MTSDDERRQQQQRHSDKDEIHLLTTFTSIHILPHTAHLLFIKVSMAGMVAMQWHWQLAIGRRQMADGYLAIGNWQPDIGEIRVLSSAKTNSTSRIIRQRIARGYCA